MKKAIGLTLGIMTALGGFVDLGQIVFTMQAGAFFGYALLWTIPLGTVAIILYMEMCGRISAVAKEPVFAVVRTRLGYRLGFATLIASNLLNLITCAAEIGGIGILLHLLTGWDERLAMVAAALLLAGSLHLLRFEWMERVFGLAGLSMIIYAVSAWTLGPEWPQAARGLLPSLPAQGKHDVLLYAYFAVGIFSALLMAYEVHFYSSGAIEEDWEPENLFENFAVATVGSSLGAVLTIALLVLGALVFLPRGIFPDALSSTALPAALPFARKALRLALLGALACITGAAVETALSGGYNLCQFYHLAWGKNLKAKDAPVFTATWMLMLAIACIIAVTGARPLTLVDISIVFGMVVLPFTYYPILRTAGDRNIMGRHANGAVLNAAGWFFLVLITLAALAAIPLMILTHSGRP